MSIVDRMLDVLFAFGVVLVLLVVLGPFWFLASLDPFLKNDPRRDFLVPVWWIFLLLVALTSLGNP